MTVKIWFDDMRKKLTTICVIAMFTLTSSTAVSSLVTKINISEDTLSDIKPVIMPSNGYRDYTEDDGVIRIEDNDDFINHPAVTPGEIERGTLIGILKQAKINRDEFLKEYKK